VLSFQVWVVAPAGKAGIARTEYHVPGIFTWFGLAATLLLLATGGALLAAGRIWPVVVRRWTSRLLAFLRVVVPLAGLALVLFLGLILYPPGLAPEKSLGTVASLLALPFLLMATLFLRKTVWPAVALILTGLAVLALLWLLLGLIGENPHRAWLIEGPRPISSTPWEVDGPVVKTPALYLELALAGGLVALGCWQLGRGLRKQ
jgi:hypothetical protein